MSENGILSFDDPKVKQEIIKELFDDDLLLCPICGYDYTHLSSIEPYNEKDGRLCVKLHFYCEEGHNFYIDFLQHEGMTFVSKKEV